MRILLLLLMLAACSSARGSDEGTPSPVRGSATLQVDNQGFLDMTVYAVDGARRERLGIARGHATTTLTIPDRLVRGGAAPLQFLCDPIGDEGLPVSQEITVEPGDEVELIIPPS